MAKLLISIRLKVIHWIMNCSLFPLFTLTGARLFNKSSYKERTGGVRLSPGPRQALQLNKRNAWNDNGWQNSTLCCYFRAFNATSEDVTSHYFLATSPSDFQFPLKWRSTGRIVLTSLEHFKAPCMVGLYSHWQPVLPRSSLADHTEVWAGYKNFYTEWAAKHWHRLPREVLEPPSLEGFISCADVAFGDMV